MAHRTLPITVSTPGIVITGGNVLCSMYVNSTTSGTMVIYDALAATSGYAISGTMTPAVGYHNLENMTNTQGVYVDLSNINVTFKFLEAD